MVIQRGESNEILMAASLRLYGFSFIPLILFIPCMLFLSKFFGVNAVWVTQPLVDFVMIALIMQIKEVKKIMAMGGFN